MIVAARGAASLTFPDEGATSTAGEADTMHQRRDSGRQPAYKHVAVSSMRVSERVTRRPIPSRSASWAILAARRLQRAGVRPNQISMLGVVLAALAAGCLIFAGRSEGQTRIALLVVAAAAMPLRLLCNMLDGMLAVEGGLTTPTGELYNELPDRLADLLIFVGAGYAVVEVPWGPELGWAAATTALLTAYVRTLGAAAGASHHFVGPMAKPRRMHVLIAACLLSAVETAVGWREGWALVVALILIIAGGVVTMLRRLRRIVADLEAT
jgi:phosphatidylglycerophosphate synthase